MAHIAHNGQHHELNAGLAQVLRVLAALTAGATVAAVVARARLQHVLHDENNVLDELGVGVDDNDLAALIKELLDDNLDLIKKNRIESRAHLVPDEFLHVFLDLGAEFLVQTDEETEKVAEELGDGTVLPLLPGRVGQDGDAGRATAAPARKVVPARGGRGFALQADTAQSQQESSHVGPLSYLVLKLMVRRVVAC